MQSHPSLSTPQSPEHLSGTGTQVPGHLDTEIQFVFSSLESHRGADMGAVSSGYLFWVLRARSRGEGLREWQLRFKKKPIGRVVTRLWQNLEGVCTQQ